MNFELHIIGSRNGLEMVPWDGLDEELRHCAVLHKTEETLVVSLASEIVHYVYLHQIGSENAKEFFGFVVSFNGICFRSAERAFDMMERLYETAVYEGLLLHVADNGQVEFSPQPFYEQKAPVQRIEQEARSLVDALPRSGFVGQPRNYRTGNGDTTIRLSEGDAAVADKVAHFDHVAVVREQSHSGLNDMQSRLRLLHAQSTEWEKKYHEEHKKKKQYSLVVVLLLVLLIVGGVAAYVIWNNLSRIDSLEETVREREKDIAEKKGIIREKSLHIVKLQDTVLQKNNQISRLTDTMNQMTAKVNRYANIIHATGLPPIANNEMDNGYVMWLYASAPVTITKIWLRANQSGRVRIVLRDAGGYMVDNEYVSVSSSFGGKYLSLNIPQQGYYSLSIEDYGNMKFQYSSGVREAYRAFDSDMLRIVGCCNRGKGYNAAGQKYYQYFYNIHYRVTL